MGIVNLTPDSFYGGSRAGDVDAAVDRALRLVGEGADILDLGAESSRPGAEPVGADEEQARLLPVVTALAARTDTPLSVDTLRADTARAALAAGATIVNDISAGGDPDMFGVAAAHPCGLVLMHMQGTPRTMQQSPRYRDPVAEITGYLAARARLAEEAGVPAGRIVVDPGIGFGKSLAHNLDLLRALRAITGPRPLLLGASRKRFIAELTGAGVDDRLPGSLAALVAAWHAGAAVVRVHDVAASVQFLTVLGAVARGTGD
ncbi:dihydropteroate synthase [bacterium]|nr:dihydropteroate synthase [bacterium]